MKNASELKIGEQYRVKELLASSLTLKLLEMGFLPGTRVKLLRKAPLGSPLYISINDHYVALREEEAATVLVEEFHAK